jgi:hypothetical protein
VQEKIDESIIFDGKLENRFTVEYLDWFDTRFYRRIIVKKEPDHLSHTENLIEYDQLDDLKFKLK